VGSARLKLSTKNRGTPRKRVSFLERGGVTGGGKGGSPTVKQRGQGVSGGKKVRPTVVTIKAKEKKKSLVLENFLGRQSKLGVNEELLRKPTKKKEKVRCGAPDKMGGKDQGVKKKGLTKKKGSFGCQIRKRGRKQGLYIEGSSFSGEKRWGLGGRGKGGEV